MADSAEILLKKILDKTNIEEVIGKSKDYPFETINKLSIETALKYYKGDLTFQEGNNVMNKLWSFWVFHADNTNNWFGELPYECYEAFDLGEWVGDTTPIKHPDEIVKPIIEGILKRL